MRVLLKSMEEVRNDPDLVDFDKDWDGDYWCVYEKDCQYLMGRLEHLFDGKTWVDVEAYQKPDKYANCSSEKERFFVINEHWVKGVEE